MQRAAKQVGLTVEHQQLGYCLRDDAGRIIASQLSMEHIAALLLGRLNALFSETIRAAAEGVRH
jgi:hypothetical protein